MPLKRKLVTIAFLSLGFIVIGIGISRLIWLLNAFKGKVNNYSVQSAYSAIESSVAIVGTSGPTVKYILSRFIPWLRPSFERASTNKPSQQGYGNSSAIGTSRRVKSQYTTGAGYNDLDSVSAKNEEIEMKNDWRCESDTHSDEQHINGDSPGIVKSVEWTVHSREDSHAARVSAMEPNTAGRPAASPAHIV
jgi:hypothetical protein